MHFPPRRRLHPAAETFAPTREAARERLRHADPLAYARRRNHLDAPVTRLSPYLTHGLLGMREVAAFLRGRFQPEILEALEHQLAVREFYLHAWRHLGERILQDLGTPPAARYRADLPVDIRHAATGVPVIDQSVRQLYRTGYLHHQQRLWLASYVVHLRKVHWRAGADWLYGHLMDGDLGANHLSWQGVAGTFGRKPHLYNNDHVVRHAPALASPVTAIDRTYAELEAFAASPAAEQAEPGDAHAAVEEPPLLSRPPGGDVSFPPPGAVEDGVRVLLVHPWSLGECAEADLRIGFIHLPFHRHFPWSARRWAFVLQAMRDTCDAVFVGDGAALVSRLSQAGRVLAQETYNPGYAGLLRAPAVHVLAREREWADPDILHATFHDFWSTVRSGRVRRRLYGLHRRR